MGSNHSHIYLWVHFMRPGLSSDLNLLSLLFAYLYDPAIILVSLKVWSWSTHMSREEYQHARNGESHPWVIPTLQLCARSAWQGLESWHGVVREAEVRLQSWVAMISIVANPSYPEAAVKHLRNIVLPCMIGLFLPPQPCVLFEFGTLRSICEDSCCIVATVWCQYRSGQSRKKRWVLCTTNYMHVNSKLHH